MNRTVVILVQIGALLGAAFCLFFQVVVIPQAVPAEAALDPVIAQVEGRLIVVGILGLVCVQVVLIATAVLAQMSLGEGIFSRRAFAWVDLVIAACLAASALCVGFLVSTAWLPPLTPNPDGAGDMTDVSLLFFCMAGAGTALGLAMVVFVMRGLLRRAVTLHDELAEVV